MNKFQKYLTGAWLLFPGILILCSGLGWGWIVYHWSWESLWFCALGLLLVGMGLRGMCSRRYVRSAEENKSLRRRQMILIVGLIFLVVVNYAGYRWNRRWDVTAAKTHTLSEATEQFIKNLDKPLKMTVFYAGIAPKYLEDLLESYRQISGNNLDIEIVDPLVNLGYAAQFGNQINGDERRLIIQDPEGERRDVPFTDDVLTENHINNAILQLTRPPRTACFTGGHGEADPLNEDKEGLSTFGQHLAENNIIVERLNVGLQTGVPDTCDILIIAGPTDPLRNDEQDAIGAYLRAGGDALIMVENIIISPADVPLLPDQIDRNPSLNGLLHSWGVKVNDDIVVDLSSHASGDVASPATKNYMSHRAIVGDLDYTFFIRPRSVSILKGYRRTLKLAPLILTESTESSWGETNRHLEVKFDSETDRPGPVPIAYVIFEPGIGAQSATRIMVITDKDFLTNAYIGYYSNARLGLNAVNWLTEKDYQVFVNKDKGVQPVLSLTSQQKRVVVLILLTAPLVILLFWLCRLIRKV